MRIGPQVTNIGPLASKQLKMPERTEPFCHDQQLRLLLRWEWMQLCTGLSMCKSSPHTQPERSHRHLLRLVCGSVITSKFLYHTLGSAVQLAPYSWQLCQTAHGWVMADSFVGWLPVPWVGALVGIPECEAVADPPMGGAGVGSHSQGFANMLAPVIS